MHQSSHDGHTSLIMQEDKILAVSYRPELKDQWVDAQTPSGIQRRRMDIPADLAIMWKNTGLMSQRGQVASQTWETLKLIYPDITESDFEEDTGSEPTTLVTPHGS